MVPRWAIILKDFLLVRLCYTQHLSKLFPFHLRDIGCSCTERVNCIGILFRNLVKISKKLNSVKGWLCWNNTVIFYQPLHWKDIRGGNQKRQTSQTKFIFSPFSFYFFFCFLPLHSRLKQFPFLLMHNAQISNAVFLNIMLIFVDVRVFIITVEWIIPG